MNKGIKKKLLLLTITVIMTMAVGGCGGSDSNETTTQSVGEETSTQSGELTREELLFGDVWLCGEKINFPCKVKDLPEGIELGKGVVITTENDGNCASIELLKNGEKVAKIMIYGVDKEPGGYYDFSKGYEEYSIHQLLDVDGHIEARGISKENSKQDIINMFGEPDLIKEDVYMYYWLDEDKKSYVYFNLLYYEKKGTEIVFVNWEE